MLWFLMVPHLIVEEIAYFDKKNIFFFFNMNWVCTKQYIYANKLDDFIWMISFFVKFNYLQIERLFIVYLIKNQIQIENSILFVEIKVIVVT